MINVQVGYLVKPCKFPMCVFLHEEAGECCSAAVFPYTDVSEHTVVLEYTAYLRTSVYFSSQHMRRINYTNKYMTIIHVRSPRAVQGLRTGPDSRWPTRAPDGQTLTGRWILKEKVYWFLKKCTLLCSCRGTYLYPKLIYESRRTSLVNAWPH